MKRVEDVSAVLAAISAGVVVQDAHGRIVAANPAAELVLGLSLAQLQGRTSSDERWQAVREDGSPFPGEDHPAMVCLRTGVPVSEVLMGLPGPDGERRWLSIDARPLPGPEGALEAVITTFRDVTRRRRLDLDLRASEARFRGLADAAPVGIFQADRQGRLAYANRALVELVGRALEPGQALSWDQVVLADDRHLVVEEVVKGVSGGQPIQVEFRLARPDRRPVVVRGDGAALRDARGAVTGFVGVLTDVTERRLLQDQLAANARLAAMATLVGGVAHEVNNPLAVVSASRDWATETLSELRGELAAGAGGSPARLLERIDEVLGALRETQAGVARIAAIVRDLKLIGRPEPTRRPADLAALALQALRWIPPPLSGRARLSMEDLGAPPVLAAEGQLELVVINLVTNALQSIAPGRTGAVRVRVGPGRGGAARLEVIDDGVGMTREVASRIFDPFFTTREVGQGLGLGLTVAHSIVATHGGLLEVESSPGAGSTFRAELPAAPSDGGR